MHWPCPLPPGMNIRNTVIFSPQAKPADAVPASLRSGISWTASDKAAAQARWCSATSISGRSLSWWRSGPWLGVCPTIRSFGKKVRQHLRLFQCFHVLLGKSLHHDSKETSLGHWEAAASLHLAFPATFLDAARARTAAVRNLRNDSGSRPSLSRDISSRVWNTCMSCRNICLLSDVSCGATWLRRQWGSFPSPGRTTVSRDGVLCAWARAEWRERHMNEWTPRRFQGRKGWVPVVCPLGGSCRGKLHPCNV